MPGVLAVAARMDHTRAASTRQSCLNPLHERVIGEHAMASRHAIQARHRRKSLRRVLEEFDDSWREILALVRDLPPEEILTPGYHEWTGRYPLATYLAPNTCSHYRTATKFLKRWLRS